jgi:hypothetical protein
MDYSHLSNITKKIGEKKIKIHVHTCIYLLKKPKKITYFPTYLPICLQDLSDLKLLFF